MSDEAVEEESDDGGEPERPSLEGQPILNSEDPDSGSDDS